MQAPIEAVAFDLWNTVVGCAHPVNPMRRLVEAVRAAGGADTHALISECTMRAPLPGIAAAVRELERRLGGALCRGEARARLLDLWAESAGYNRVLEDVEPVLSRLKRRFRLGVISNTQSFDLEFWERSAARALLEVEILSYREGMLKPDPGLFQRFASALGVPPRRILMVGDNSVDDIQGAKAAGFQALRIARALPTLSHREPAGEDTPLDGLEELERRLRSLSAPGGRPGAAPPPRAAPRHARARRGKRR